MVRKNTIGFSDLTTEISLKIKDGQSGEVLCFAPMLVEPAERVVFYRC